MRCAVAGKHEHRATEVAMGLKLKFTIKLPGATKVALRVDHDKDGLIDEEKPVDLERTKDTWHGSVELTSMDPEGVHYVCSVTSQKEQAQLKVTVSRDDTGEQLGATFIAAIPKGSYQVPRWVGGP